jgi:hypothetical protein
MGDCTGMGTISTGSTSSTQSNSSSLPVGEQTRVGAELVSNLGLGKAASRELGATAGSAGTAAIAKAAGSVKAEEIAASATIFRQAARRTFENDNKSIPLHPTYGSPARHGQTCRAAPPEGPYSQFPPVLAGRSSAAFFASPP